MRIASFIGLRFLRSPRQSRSITVVTWVSGGGVMLGVAALIITISVMNGFRENLFLSVTGTMSHVRIAPAEGWMSADTAADLATKLEALPSVAASAPYFSRQAFIRAGGVYRAVILRGVDPEREAAITPLNHFVREGPAFPKEGAATPNPPDAPPPELGIAPGRLGELLAYPPPRGERTGIILGRPLAEALEVLPGEEVDIVSTVTRLTPIGPVPLIKRFRVVGLLDTGIGAVDEVAAYTHLIPAQRLHRATDAVVGLALALENPQDIDPAPIEAIAREVAAGAGLPSLRVTTWAEENRNIFQVMKLEKLGIFIVLTLIILVAFFNIIASLIMQVLEKRKAIAVLMSLGASGRMVREIFFMQGVWIGTIGTLSGLSLGLVACWLLATFDLVPLPPGVFPLARHLPILVNPVDLALITGCSFLICLLVTLYPATAASRTDPVQNLRGD